MGTNIHALAHRLTALSMACLASAAFVLCALSGFGCSFVRITPLDGRSIGNAYGDEYVRLFESESQFESEFESDDPQDDGTAYLGVRCLSGADAFFYAPDGGTDRLWSLGRLFLYIGLALGSSTAAFAWLLTSCVRPTAPRWRILSVLAACAAVFQIPVFLVFESDNCNFDVFRQICALGPSAYLNVASVAIWIVTTVWVQCLRAPRWDEELDAWRVDHGSSSSLHDARSRDGSGISKGTGTRNSHSHSHSHSNSYYGNGNGNGNGTVETTQNDSGDLEHQPQRNGAPPAIGFGRNRSPGHSHSNSHSRSHSSGSGSGQHRDWATNASHNDDSSAPTNAMKRSLAARPREAARNGNQYQYQHQYRAATAAGRRQPQPQRPTADAARPSILKSLLNKSNRSMLQPTRSAPERSSSLSRAETGAVPSGEPESPARGFAEGIDVPRLRSSFDETLDTSGVADNDRDPDRAAPGFHISCVYGDGSRREAHFPSIANCCIGMGLPTEDDEATGFRTFRRVPSDFRAVERDDGRGGRNGGGDDDVNYGNDNDDNDDNDDDKNRSGDDDFLVRKLRREERAAARRNAASERAPIASLRFVTNPCLNRRTASPNGTRNGNAHSYAYAYGNGNDDGFPNDDVSEMTRGSGWASGVSEILDDDDLRHQPRAVLEELRNQY